MKIFWVGGLVLTSVFGWAGFMAADNQHPYEFDAANSYVIPLVVNDGDQILVKWKVKLNRVCPGSVHRILFDPKTRVILATYDATPAFVSEGIQTGYISRSFSLPRGSLPSGPIGYRANICYECNLLQKFVRPLCVITPELIFSIR